MVKEQFWTITRSGDKGKIRGTFETERKNILKRN